MKNKSVVGKVAGILLVGAASIPVFLFLSDLLKNQKKTYTVKNITETELELDLGGKPPLETGALYFINGIPQSVFAKSETSFDFTNVIYRDIQIGSRLFIDKEENPYVAYQIQDVSFTGQDAEIVFDLGMNPALEEGKQYTLQDGTRQYFAVASATNATTLFVQGIDEGRRQFLEQEPRNTLFVQKFYSRYSTMF